MAILLICHPSISVHWHETLCCDDLYHSRLIYMRDSIIHSIVCECVCVCVTKFLFVCSRPLNDDCPVSHQILLLKLTNSAIKILVRKKRTKRLAATTPWRILFQFHFIHSSLPRILRWFVFFLLDK